MRSEQEILERIQMEMERLEDKNGHLASAVARGWLDALEWVLALED